MDFNIIGADGQHGRDLRDRHILEHDEESPRFAVAIPIRATHRKVEDLLSTHHDHDILSLAGLMSITPDDPRVGMMHFLFWPTMSRDLHVAVARETHIPAGFLTEIRQKWIEIIRTTPREHDQMMGFVQALPHLFLTARLLTMREPEIDKKSSLLTDWKTPSPTIVDMIGNPLAWGTLARFLDSTKHQSLEQAFLDIFWSTNKVREDERWWTPNTRRVQAHCLRWVETIFPNESRSILDDLLHNPERLQRFLDSRFSTHPPLL